MEPEVASLDWALRMDSGSDVVGKREDERGGRSINHVNFVELLPRVGHHTGEYTSTYLPTYLSRYMSFGW